MCQDVENIDFDALDEAAEEFYQKFLEEIGDETLWERQSREDEAEYLRQKARRPNGQIQSIEEQNRILHEYIVKNPSPLLPNGLTGSEYTDLCDQAWRAHDWNELARLYELEPTEELFEQFEKTARQKDALSS